MTHNTRDYAALLRSQGFRVTPQRRLILDAVCEGGGHTTLEEVYARVHERAPVINRATFYRTLNFLCEMRLVVAADIGDGRTVYEIAGVQPHHHLVCRACGYVFQVDHEALAALFTQVDREFDFEIDMDHLVLFGLCAHCRGQGS